VYDRTGTLCPISTQAYYVKDLKQDLLGGRAFVKSNDQVILDRDLNMSGIYPVTSAIQQTISYLLVSIQTGLSFFGHQLFPHKKIRECRDTHCGTNNCRIAPIMPFARQWTMSLG
jgi:hypothetical protein